LFPFAAAFGAMEPKLIPQHRVGPEISAGIEKHIVERTRADGGFYKLVDGSNALSLKLVRIHKEYLAQLGPGRHFACVDLVDTRGDVYDVDFFLSGEPGRMDVTQTLLHKLNGIPFYAWRQKPGGGWERVAPEKADVELLGVKHGRDEFEFLYRVELPESTEPLRVWLPLAVSDPFQDVSIISRTLPVEPTPLEGSFASNMLYLELLPGSAPRVVEIRYHVVRREKSAYVEPGDPARELIPDRRGPITPEFRKTARHLVAGKRDPLMQARAIYDHVIDRMRYMKFGDGWGQGDAVRACNARSGNCTDFHAYFIALARAAGIPARFAIGASIPSERDEGGIDGYHCWAEFHAEGKWWPVDISEADKYTGLATYFFGHHPANRIELSRGRDLAVSPLPKSGPINFLAYPVVEGAGLIPSAKVEFSFRRVKR
jgi:transglutaminase-like putative cysteine protease